MFTVQCLFCHCWGSWLHYFPKRNHCVTTKFVGKVLVSQLVFVVELCVCVSLNHGKTQSGAMLSPIISRWMPISFFFFCRHLLIRAFHVGRSRAVNNEQYAWRELFNYSSEELQATPEPKIIQKRQSEMMCLNLVYVICIHRIYIYKWKEYRFYKPLFR